FICGFGDHDDPLPFPPRRSSDLDIIQPKHSTKLDWEVELGVVIGTRAQYVPEDKALDYVAGYTVVNDVSERNFQLERGSQWDKGDRKSTRLNSSHVKISYAVFCL